MTRLVIAKTEVNLKIGGQFIRLAKNETRNVKFDNEKQFLFLVKSGVLKAIPPSQVDDVIKKVVNPVKEIEQDIRVLNLVEIRSG